MIRLARLAKDDPAPVAHIRVRPDQVPFCGTIVGHFAERDPDVDFHQVIRDGRAVGFFKIDRGYPTRFDFAAADEVGLRGVMIDAVEQGRGTGAAALAGLRDYLPPRYPGAASIVLTVNTVNPAAVRAYLRAGFVDTGAFYDGGRISPQHIMRMNLR